MRSTAERGNSQKDGHLEVWDVGSIVQCWRGSFEVSDLHSAGDPALNPSPRPGDSDI